MRYYRIISSGHVNSCSRWIGEHLCRIWPCYCAVCFATTESTCAVINQNKVRAPSNFQIDRIYIIFPKCFLQFLWPGITYPVVVNNKLLGHENMIVINIRFENFICFLSHGAANDTSHYIFHPNINSIHVVGEHYYIYIIHHEHISVHVELKLEHKVNMHQQVQILCCNCKRR